MSGLSLLPVEGLPEVGRGDDLAELIASRFSLEPGDVLVVAQKIVSKSEGRIRRLAEITPGARACGLGRRLGADPRFVQAILDESVSTPTRLKPRVLLEEIDGDMLVVRVQATPVRAADGAGLADEIIAALTSITGDHRKAAADEPQPRTAGTFSRPTRA